MESTPWHRASEHAASQFGVLDHGQLLEAGFSRSSISRLVARGQLHRLHRRVYGLGQVPTDPRAPLLAATLLAGPGSAVVAHSAAELLGIALNRTRSVWVGGPRRIAPAPGVESGIVDFAHDEVGTFRGVPCTSPSRTLLDLAAISASLAAAAVRTAGDRGLLDVDDVLRLLAHRRGQRGAGRLRALMLGGERVPVFTRSELERRLWLLCRRHGIEPPEMNADVYAGDHLYECDAVWPRYRLIVECDSHWHDNPVSGRADAERDERLTLSGWRVFRIRWAQVALQPARTAAALRHLIADQGRLVASLETRPTASETQSVPRA